MKIFFLLMIVCGVTDFSLIARAEVKIEDIDPSFDELEGVELIEELIFFGKLKQARVVIDEMQKKSQNSLALQLAQGNLNFIEGDYAGALVVFQNLFENRDRFEVKEAKQIQLRLAETHKALSQPAKCTQLYHAGLEPLNSQDAMLFIQCAKESENYSLAWKLLSQPTEDLNLLIERLKFLVQKQLNHVAEQEAFLILAKKELNPSDGLAIVQVFHETKQVEASFRLLEFVRLRFPHSLDVNLAWAQGSYGEGLSHLTVEAFLRVASQDPDYFYHVTEFYRQLGKFYLSEYYSQFIADKEKRLRAKIALAIDKATYVKILSYARAIEASPVLQDEDIRYALGFSYLQAGNHQKAFSHLDRLQRRDLQIRVGKIKEIFR